LQLAQISALFEVQLGPVAAVPSEQVQVLALIVAVVLVCVLVVKQSGKVVAAVL
jgi:hypothetical protein